MAIKSPKIMQYLGIPYPDEDCDPFYDQFEAMVQGIERALFFSKVFSNCVFGGGGTRAWDGTTGVFTWTSDFTLMVPQWGYKASLRYGSDNATRYASLFDGQFLVARLPMGMNDNIVLNFIQGSQLDQSRHDEIVLAARIGSKLHLRSIGEVS